jgi:hypothetical protein
MRLAKPLSAIPAWALAISAHCAVLSFDGDICEGPTGACEDAFAVLQTYGDQPGVLDVVYDRDILVQGLAPMIFWSGQYSGLRNVAFGTGLGLRGTAEIFLRPRTGYAVTLHGFSLGAWPNVDRGSQYAVLGGDGTPLFQSGPITVLGSAPTQAAFDLTRSDGIRIQWGPDAYNVAIDDIAFSMLRVGPIPEPTTLALIALGLGVVACKARRNAS